MTDDRMLVAAVLERRPGAFETLVREHQGLCFSIVVRLVRHPEDARELCQESFLLVHRHLRQYRHDSPLRSWIGRIAYRVALRHLQRKRVPLVTVSPRDDDSGDYVDPLVAWPADTDLERDAIAEEERRVIRAGMEALPPLLRLVLTLYHLHECSIAEIAAVTQLPEGTIKSHLFRARARLRRQLDSSLGVGYAADR